MVELDTKFSVPLGKGSSFYGYSHFLPRWQALMGATRGPALPTLCFKSGCFNVKVNVLFSVFIIYFI